MDRAHRIGQKRVVNVYRYFNFFYTVFIKQKKRYHPDDDTNDDYNTNTNNTNNIVIHIFFSTDQNYTSTNINDTF